MEWPGVVQLMFYDTDLVAEILTTPPLPCSILALMEWAGGCFSMYIASRQCNLSSLFSLETIDVEYTWCIPPCESTSCLHKGFDDDLALWPVKWLLILLCKDVLVIPMHISFIIYLRCEGSGIIVFPLLITILSQPRKSGTCFLCIHKYHVDYQI